MRIGAANPQLSQLTQLQQGPKPQLAEKDIAQLGNQDFGSMLKSALSDVNRIQNDSGQLQNDYLQGKPVEFHDLMIKMEQASTAMALTMQVRNKLLEAYQEISRTQI